MTDCLDENLLAALADGELAVSAGAEVEEHIAHCAGCAAVVAELGRDDASAEGADAPASPRVGAFVGPYRLVERLGHGCAGQRFTAEDSSGRRRIVELARTSGNPAATDAFGQGLRVPAHPNIIPIEDAGTAAGVTFVTTAPADGTRLDRYLAERSLRARAVVGLFLPAGAALAAAHAAGVVHGRFDASQVIVNRRGGVRVGGFCLGEDICTAVKSHAVDDADAEHLDPKARPGHCADPRDDRYRFCAALADALAASPDRGYGPDPRLAAAGDVSARAGAAPAPLARLLARELADHPEDRYPSMDALLRDLRRYQRGRRVLLVATLIVAAVVLVSAAATLVA